LTKEFNSSLIISESTHERLRGSIPCRSLGNFKVKGREKPVALYAPVTGSEQQ
jgi:class 3 adenylate cyclase